MCSLTSLYANLSVAVAASSVLGGIAGAFLANRLADNWEREWLRKRQERIRILRAENVTREKRRRVLKSHCHVRVCAASG